MHAGQTKPVHRGCALQVLAILFFGNAAGCATGDASTQVGTKSAGPSPGGKQQVFPDPEVAVETLLAAFEKEDERALLDIFGHEHEKLIVMKDKIARREALQQLVQAAQQMKKLEKEGDDKLTLILGEQSWPFPIPLVKEASGWRFDTAAGAEEILNRRIGENELEGIANCRAFVAVQVQYAEKDRDGDEVPEYAQRIRSTEGKQDGLYWDADPSQGEELSPFGPLVAEAPAYLEASRKSKIPFKGYYYKMLTQQGSNPPGGEYDYVINGNMIAGFALVAVPADYGASGIMTFLVSHHGKVYEKDLGEKSLETGRKMLAFNPDTTWRRVETE